MVQFLNKKFLKRRRRAIKSVLQACLPDFLNKVFLRMLGLLTHETPPDMITYNPPSGVDELPPPVAPTAMSTETVTETLSSETTASATRTTANDPRKKRRHRKKHQ